MWIMEVSFISTCNTQVYITFMKVNVLTVRMFFQCNINHVEEFIEGHGPKQNGTKSKLIFFGPPQEEIISAV